MFLTDEELKNIVARAVANCYYPKTKFEDKDSINIPMEAIEVAVHAARLANVETLEKLNLIKSRR